MPTFTKGWALFGTLKGRRELLNWSEDVKDVAAELASGFYQANGYRRFIIKAHKWEEETVEEYNARQESIRKSMAMGEEMRAKIADPNSDYAKSLVMARKNAELARIEMEFPLTT